MKEQSLYEFALRNDLISLESEYDEQTLKSIISTQYQIVESLYNYILIPLDIFKSYPEDIDGNKQIPLSELTSYPVCKF
jgi:hypothetical protein